MHDLHVQLVNQFENKLLQQPVINTRPAAAAAASIPLHVLISLVPIHKNHSFINSPTQKQQQPLSSL